MGAGRRSRPDRGREEFGRSARLWTSLAPRPLRWISAVPFLVLAAAGCSSPSPAVLSLPISEGWEFRLAPDSPRSMTPGHLLDTLSTWLPATVPGTVHTDLLASGLIPDPFWRDEELRLQWIGQESWVYRTRFQGSRRILEQERVELVFHGLDTFAEVRLNGQVILEANNMFRGWPVDVTGRIREGDNQLEVTFRSPLPVAQEARERLSYTLPAGNDRGDPPSRVFVRKAAYHYGWDWGPRFVTSGIWRAVELRAWSGARITTVHLVTDSLSPDGATVRALVEVETSREEAERRAAGGGVPARLVLESPDGAFPSVSAEILPERGLETFTVPFRIPDPRLWWPNGLGEPHLYSVQAILDAGRRSDTLTTRMGLRDVELVTESDSIGESFYFRINGLPVFMKGANVIPMDHFSPRVTLEEYAALFRDVAGASMNMLRVWGGGIYEEDAFYDLADEHGILIWQDFMFANGMYPGDSLFLSNVQREAVYQVRRLRNHPSLALWCGNNEMDEAWHNWGWARSYESPEDSAAVRGAYEAIFHEILPAAVEAQDGTRRYWPSSPSLGWGDSKSLERGDSHYWGVWHGREPFEAYQEKLPRFSSEFGFQAFPPMETIEAFTAPEDRELQDPTLLVHQKHPIGNELIAEYMARHYPVPPGFQDFVYVSQLLQAEGIGTAMEAHRRARPRTMGSLYWQLNDTWPAISWSSRDYYGRWKALHYTARDAFAPLLISVTSRGDTLEVWGISDLDHLVSRTLFLELLDFQGTSLWQVPVEVDLNPLESRILWKRSIQELLGQADPRRVVLVAELRQDPPASRRQDAGEESPPRASGTRSHASGARGQASDHTSATLHYFVARKDLTLEIPAIVLNLDRDGETTLLTLESSVLAKDVQLTFPGVHFPQNFFDLLPGRARTLRLETDLSQAEVERELRIKTLADVPRDGLEPEGGSDMGGG